MIYNIYGLRDRLNGFTGINLDVNDDTAKRGFAMAVSSDNGIIGFRPGDFEICRLGTFDTLTGRIDVLPLPDLLMNGDQVRSERKDENEHA